jgi:hypothetical protein
MCSLVYYTGSDGYNYISSFNSEWIATHEQDLSGPKHCLNCRYHCSVPISNDLVFIGYCLNCAQFCYDGKRGVFDFTTTNDYKQIIKRVPDYVLETEKDYIYSFFDNWNSCKDMYDDNDDLEYDDLDHDDFYV